MAHSELPAAVLHDWEVDDVGSRRRTYLFRR